MLQLSDYEERCPGCQGQLSPGVCRFAYTNWRCLECGATLDSRVVMPELIEKKKTMNKHDWRPPVYSAGRINTNDQVMICEFCKTIVWDASSHTAWHLQLWTALTKLDEKVNNGT